MGYSHFYMCKTFDRKTLISAAREETVKALAEIDIAEGTTRAQIVYGVCQKTPVLSYVKAVLPQFNTNLSRIKEADKKIVSEVLTFIEPSELCSTFSACFNALNSPQPGWNQERFHFTGSWS